MHRLTEWDEKEQKFDRISIITTNQQLIDKLAEYEDLEESGRLVKLPCAVGDTVYVPTRNFVSEFTVNVITIGRNEIIFGWILNKGIYPNLTGFSEHEIGNIVFLTREAAEAKLKETEGKYEKND